MNPTCDEIQTTVKERFARVARSLASARAALGREQGKRPLAVRVAKPAVPESGRLDAVRTYYSGRPQLGIMAVAATRKQPVDLNLALATELPQEN